MRLWKFVVFPNFLCSGISCSTSSMWKRAEIWLLGDDLCKLIRCAKWPSYRCRAWSFSHDEVRLSLHGFPVKKEVPPARTELAANHLPNWIAWDRSSEGQRPHNASRRWSHAARSQLSSTHSPLAYRSKYHSGHSQSPMASAHAKGLLASLQTFSNADATGRKNKYAWSAQDTQFLLNLRRRSENLSSKHCVYAARQNLNGFTHKGVGLQKCSWIYLNQNANHVRHIDNYFGRFSTTTRSIWKTIPSSSRLQARTELLVKPRAKWRPCSNVSGLKYQTSKFNRKLHFQMRLQFQHEQQPLQITTNKESPARHKYTSKHKGTVWTWFLTYTYHKTKCTIQGDTHILERSLPPEFLKTYHLCFVIIRHGLRCMEINNASSRSTSIFF